MDCELTYYGGILLEAIKPATPMHWSHLRHPLLQQSCPCRQACRGSTHVISLAQLVHGLHRKVVSL
eukprot:1127284-Pelagomonas_calceolata.AAC.1